MKKSFFIVFLFALLLSCKKDKTVTMVISGTVYDGVNGGGTSGAVVSLSYQQYQNGVASGAFTTLGTYTTSTDGEYTFSFEKPSAIKYRIQISRTDYFGISEDINPDALSMTSTNVRNYTMYPSATFKISMKNLTPFNSSDQIVYQNLSESSSCSGCCNNSLKVFNGMVVDTSMTCTRYGDKYVKFQWIVTKNAMTNTYVDSIFCPKGQLTSYQINY